MKILPGAMAFCAALIPRLAAAEVSCHVYEAAPGSGSGLAELAYSSDGKFDFTLPGAPYAVFGGTCPLGNDGTATCPVDCDGGSVSLWREGEALVFDFSGLRVERLRMESLTFGLVQFDSDGLRVRGIYRLDAAEPAQCMALASRKQPLVLEPGDTYPAVERIEAALAVSGHFAGIPDWLFTSATADALRLFQAESGLPQNGRATWETLQLLGVQVTYGYGGC